MNAAAVSTPRSKPLKRRLGLALAGALGPTAMHALHRSLDLHVEGDHHPRQLRERGERVLYAVWHGRMLTPIWCHRDQGITVLVSEHADGEALARVMSGLGFGAARGSSTRGGARGLKRLIRAARQGQHLAITPDGPRGPRYEAKIGLIVAAQLTGAHIVPLSACATRHWTLGSWDGFQIPRPGSASFVEYGPPVHVPRGLDEAQREAVRIHVQRTMNQLTARVDSRAQGGGATFNPDQTEASIRAAVD